MTNLPSPTATPASGWYHDGTALRWWDGTQWGPYAPAGPPIANQSNLRTWAILAHLPLLNIVLPIIAYALYGDKDPFVKHHAVEALNHQITVFAVQMVGMVIFMSTMMNSMFGDFGERGQPFNTTGFVTIWLVFGGLGIYNLVMGVVGMISASRGKLFRYPVAIRLVKGALPKGTASPVAAP
jgi:uncharacterized protein